MCIMIIFSDAFMLLFTGKSSLVDIFESNLRKLYEVTRIHSEGNQWPPNQPKKIVNVRVMHHTTKKAQKEALVKQHKIGSPSIHKKNLLSEPSHPKPQKYGKDPSHDTKLITIDISNIFFADPTAESSMAPKTILIEGAPGIGKTVFSKEIAYKWAISELLDNKKFLLLFCMRDQYIQTIKSLSDLLEVYIANKDKEMISHVEQYISRNFGEDVVFLLDGLDECPVNKKNPFLNRLMHGNILPKAMVVVTSRPTCSASSFEKKVEILGFSEEQRNQYIDMSLSKKSSKVKLLEYLDIHPIINSVCDRPLCLAILIHLFKARSLPKTLTEMNKFFIIHTVCHYMGKEGEPLSRGITDIKDFPETIYAIVHKLSLLAYVGLQQGKLVFTSAEVKRICPEMFIDKGESNGYGLLQCVKHDSQRGGAAGHTTSFNFLHFTMQEFLAAYFLSNLPPEKQIIEMSTFWRDDLAFMWMMFVGILGVQSTAFQKLLREIASGDTVIDKQKVLHLFQCIMEGGNSDVKLPYVISGLFTDGHINLQGLTLLPYHVLSLTIFMTKSLSIWKSINLQNCHIGDTGMKILKHFFCSKRYKAITSTIEQINIFGNDLPSIHDAYSNVIENGYFHSFKLSKHHLSDKFVTAVTKAVAKNNTIQALDLSDNNFGVDGVSAVAECLKTNMTLLSLDISGNSFGHCGAKLIADALCSNTVLKELKMSRCDLCDDGTAVFIKCLGYSKLNKLDLSWNCISSKGASKIVHSLGFKQDADTSTEGATNCNQLKNEANSQASTNIEVLNLSHNKLNDSGAECLSHMLTANSLLKELDISYNGFTDEGVAFICDSLLLNTALKHLNMSGNYVTSASRIAGVLERNRSLAYLDLQQYPTKHLSFYSTILNALHKNNILRWLGLPKCTEQSQLDQAIAEINKYRSHQNICTITTKYYN